MNSISDAALPLFKRINALMAAQALLSIVIGFCGFRVFPFIGSILIFWVLLGMLAVRRMKSCGLRVYAFLHLIFLGAALGVGVHFRHRLLNHSLPLYLILLACFSWFVQLSTSFCALRLARVLSEMPQVVTEEAFELEDLEAQDSEYPGGYHAVPQNEPATPAAPAVSPAPIYIAAPAYYPQLNDNPPAYIYGQGAVPQFVPVFIDASGKPLAPIHTQ